MFKGAFSNSTNHYTLVMFKVAFSDSSNLFHLSHRYVTESGRMSWMSCVSISRYTQLLNAIPFFLLLLFHVNNLNKSYGHGVFSF